MSSLLLNSHMPVRMICGAGCVLQNARLFASFGRACLIVTTPSAAKKSGALSDCQKALETAGVSYTVFDGVEPNPSTKTCYEAGAAARETGADFIVGIGGGSAMDAAKAVAIYAANPQMTHDGIYGREIPAAAKPVVLVGTTAGTGSEVTGVSVLTNSDNGRKKSISGADCYARVSFCDYRYTCGLPAGITRSTALDAFAHAAESLFSSMRNDLSALYALKAISLLRSFFADPALSAAAPAEEERDAWYAASLYAGLAINITGTVFPHTLGYHLTERYGVPHGIACVAFFPCLLERAQKKCPEQVEALEAAAGLDAEVIAERIASVCRFAFSVSEAEAVEVAKRWENGIKNFDRSPGGFTCEDAVAAYLSL